MNAVPLRQPAADVEDDVGEWDEPESPESIAPPLPEPPVLGPDGFVEDGGHELQDEGTGTTRLSAEQPLRPWRRAEAFIDGEAGVPSTDPAFQQVLDQLDELQAVTDSIAFGQSRIELAVSQIQSSIQARSVVHTDPMHERELQKEHFNGHFKHRHAMEQWDPNGQGHAVDQHHGLSPRLTMPRTSVGRQRIWLQPHAEHGDAAKRPSDRAQFALGAVKSERPHDVAKVVTEMSGKSRGSVLGIGVNPVIRQREGFKALRPAISGKLAGERKTWQTLTASGNLRLVPDLDQGRPSWLPSMFPMHPDSKFRTTLDIVGIMTLIFDSIWVPYQLAWDAVMTGGLWIASWVMALFWTFELVLGFLTGYQRPYQAQVEMRCNYIFRNYIKSLDFILNLVAVVSDWASVILETGDNSNSLLRLFRVVKLTKALRVAAVLRAGKMARAREVLLTGLRKWGIDEQIYFVESLLRLLFLILWMNHVGGCIWFVTGKTASKIWYIDNIQEEAQGLGILEAPTAEYHYLLSVYWSITSMFSGASTMAPTKTSELYLTIFYIIFGTLFGSSLISSLAAMLMDLQWNNKERQDRLKALRKYLYQHRVAATLAVPIEKEIMARMAKPKHLGEQDVEALAHLSPASRCELWYSIYGSLIEGCRFFAACSTMCSSLIKDTCFTALSHTSCTPGATIFECGAEAKGAYIISWGSLEYRAAVDDDCPEEVACGHWISEIALWSEWKHCGWLDCCTNAEILEISPEGFLKVLQRHSDAAMLARDYSEAIATAVQKYPPDLMNDLRLPLEHGRIVQSMPAESREQMSSGGLNIVSQFTWSLFRNRSLSALTCEIRAGKCDIVVEPNGKVLRFVSKAQLQLSRCGDGRLLAQLAKCVDDQLVHVACTLPETKVQGEETPKDALQRLLHQRLSHIRPGIIATSQAVTVRDCASDSEYGIPTRLHLTTFEAELESPFELPSSFTPLKAQAQSMQALGNTVGRRPATSKRNSMQGRAPRTSIRRTVSDVPTRVSGLEAFILADVAPGASYIVCAWVTPEDFEWLEDSSGGEAYLKDWIHTLDLQALSESKMIMRDFL